MSGRESASDDIQTMEAEARGGGTRAKARATKFCGHSDDRQHSVRQPPWNISSGKRDCRPGVRPMSDLDCGCRGCNIHGEDDEKERPGRPRSSTPRKPKTQTTTRKPSKPTLPPTSSLPWMPTPSDLGYDDAPRVLNDEPVLPRREPIYREGRRVAVRTRYEVLRRVPPQRLIFCAPLPHAILRGSIPPRHVWAPPEASR